MNERDAMNPDTRPAATATAERPREGGMSDAAIEAFIRRLCRRTGIAYSTDPFSYAGAMRAHLARMGANGDWAVARLDCAIFTGLLMPGMSAAGSGLSMRRSVSVRDRLFSTGYRITEPRQSDAPPS